MDENDIPSAESSGADAVTGQGATPPPPRPEPRPLWQRPWQLRRSVTDRKVKGVAGGLAAAANVDAGLVRALFVVAMLTGWGIPAYIILCIVLKDERVEAPAAPLPADQRLILRVILGVAAVISMGRLFDGWFFGGRNGGPGFGLFLVAIGAAVLWARRDQRGPSPAAVDDGVAAWPGPDPVDVDLGGAPPWSASASVPPPLGSGIDWRSKGRDLLRLIGAFIAVWALLAVLAGTALVASGAVQMRAPGVPLAFGLAGLVLLVASVMRRGRLAAMVTAIVALLMATVLAAALSSVNGAVGERVYVVRGNEPIARLYEHGAGRMVVDLGGANVTARTVTSVRAGAGQLRVVVPAADTVELRARVGAGSSDIFGAKDSGPGLSVDRTLPGSATDAAVIVLSVEIGLGELTIERAPLPSYDTPCTSPADGQITESAPATCVRPAALVGHAMWCALAVTGGTGPDARKGVCARDASAGLPGPVSQFAVACRFGAGADVSSNCTAHTAAEQAQGQRASGATTTVPTPTPVTAPQTPFAGPPTCSPARADGYAACTRSVTRGSATTVEPVLCREDATTRELLCPSP